MNVLYLIWGENVGLNPLVRNQVLSQLRASKRVSADSEFTLVIGLPLVSRKSVFRCRAYLRDLKSWVVGATSDSVSVRFHFIPVPSSWFHSQLWQLPFLHVFNFVQLGVRVLRIDPDVVHCRSYHAALIALTVRCVFHRRYKVVFDARGAFPEESVHGGHIGSESLSFKAWKRIERWLVREADAVVSVSPRLATHLRIPAVTRSECIFTTADDRIFELSTASRSAECANIRTLSYLGVLGPRSWYSMERLANLYLRFRSGGDAHLLIVSRLPADVVREAMQGHGVPLSELRVEATTEPQATAALLAQADVGAIPVRRGRGRTRRILLEVLMAAKTAEYLANGLPVVVFREATGLTELVTTHDLGQVVSEPDDLDVEALQRRREDYRERCRAFAREHFSASANALRYTELYRTLLEQEELNGWTTPL